MRWPSRLSNRFLTWLGRAPWREKSVSSPRRGPRTHVVILDGTMSSLDPGCETNAGLTYQLLRDARPQLSLYYEAGLQWRDVCSGRDVMMGRGINRQIRRAYGWLASRYRPGDRIFLLGYSRGAYAVRSLAGAIDRVGLVKAECATHRTIQLAYRHYEWTPDSEAAQAFARLHCHSSVHIDMVGVWDTVKALGLRLPLLWRLTEPRHAFHNHALGSSVRRGFQALALDETRTAYAPVLWETPQDWPGHVEQVWFRGTHGDVGGQLNGFGDARPLANIPLVWMLDRAEACGLALPNDWRADFPCDVTVPSAGSWRGMGKYFLFRRRRKWGADPSEALHDSVARDHPSASMRTMRPV